MMDPDHAHTSGISDGTLLLSVIQSGFRQKASPSSIKSWIALGSKLDGRDKITKALQYSARFIAWYYESRKYPLSSSDPYRSLQKNLTLSRKAFRLGRFINEIVAIHELLSKIKGNNMNLLLRCLKTFGQTGFWIGDNLTFLSKSKFIRYESTQFSDFGTRCYFMSTCVGFILAMDEFRSHLSLVRQLEERCQTDTSTKKNDADSAQSQDGKVLNDARSKLFLAFLSILKVHIYFYILS